MQLEPHMTPREPSSTFDIEAIRRDFPALHQLVRSKRLVYLDSAATSLKPESVINAVVQVYSRDCANIHRGVHLLSERATASYEGAREKIRAFLNAESRTEIVFVRGTTEAINLVSQSFVRPRLQPDDEILITELEHHSNIVPWQIVCEQTGAKLNVVPMTDTGEITLEAFASHLTDRTRFVAIAHVSNALGTILPVRDMIKLAHDRNIPVLVDGAQAAPHLPIDVQNLDCDFYALSGHKLYGPTGIGVLYARQEWLRDMPPYQGGGDMIESVTFQETHYNELPYKFEAGTPNIAGAIGLGAAIDYVTSIGFPALTRHETELREYGTRLLNELPGIRLIGTARAKVGVLTFAMEGVHAHDIGTIVDSEGVAIRTGHHCAQPVMDRFGLASTARASLGMYNSKEDLDNLARALKKVRELFD